MSTTAWAARSERLGVRATSLGWLEGGELPAAYAGADMFVFPSATYSGAFPHLGPGAGATRRRLSRGTRARLHAALSGV